ncbi:MAG: metallophosphoesterase [Peptococcaceae bacterium]|nr:metallophosphoesterase [Peptococcaceae bacterium]
MEKLSILHVSDFHIEENKLPDIQIVLDAFFTDIVKLTQENNVSIDCVCFTGDLIQSGAQREKQFDLAIDYFITPLMDKLQLQENNFIFVPGNHEVDLTQIDEIMEQGLCSRLISKEATNDFLDHLQSKYLTRISHFNEFTQLFHKNPIMSNTLTSAFILEKAGIKIGFACLNSAWRSTGAGDAEKGKLIIGERQVDQAYNPISECDIKIALMHHPLEWLMDHDKQAVGPLLAHFDLVLFGHLHNLSNQQIITPRQNTLYCGSGALFKGRSIYNGYSLIIINLSSFEATILVREYFDGKRSFDKALSVADEGRITYQLNPKQTSVTISLNLITNLRERLIPKVNKSLVSTMVDHSAPQQLEELFVSPNLSYKSVYRKEEEQESPKGKPKLEDILEANENVMFIGKKEIGKTTLLHYITVHYIKEFGRLFKVPFVIDLNLIPKGKNIIEKAMIDFILRSTDHQVVLTLDQIIELLQLGNCIILLDNLDISNKKQITVIKTFIDKYPGNRLIITVNEDIFTSVSEKYLPDFGCKKIYMLPFTRNDIRALITKWFNTNQSVNIVDVDQFLNKIVSHLTYIGLPRTPFIISLLLAICNNDQNYMPVNESSMIERFMEIVLEKMRLEETKISTYDFLNKENFLAFLAWHMAQKDRFYLDKHEFLELTAKYFEDIGFDLASSKFDTLFFEKGVLAEYDDKVFFRYRCLAEYYLAKKASTDPDVLDWILLPENYLRFTSEISFLTGSNRNLIKVVECLEKRLASLMQNHISLLPNLQDYGIDVDFSLSTETIEAELEECILDDEEKDKIFDYPDLSEQVNSPDAPRKVSGSNTFISTLLLFGRVIRNSEQLSAKIKERTLSLCINGYCVALAIFKQHIENITKENLNANLEQFGINRQTKDDEIKLIKNILKITVPLVLQNVASETIGSPKLKSIFERLISNKDCDDFSKFIYIFLYGDLKLPGYIDKMEKFIRCTTSKDILSLIVFKLWFYYLIGHTTPYQDKAESLLADAIIKVKKLHTRLKSEVIKTLRKKAIDIRGFLTASG